MLSQLLAVFGFFALVLILVYWVNRAVSLFDQLIADGQSFSVFLTFTALALPALVRIVLPIAAFAASVYVTNRMMSESELVVVQATGFSTFRIARPILYFGLIVAGLMLILTHILVPLSARELSMRQGQIAQTATARLLQEGQFMQAGDGVTLYIREITPEGELRDLFLSDRRSENQSTTYTAASAYVVRTELGPQLVMVDGMAQIYRPETQRLSTTSFDDLAYNLGPLISMPDPTKRSASHLMTWDLLAPSAQNLRETGKTAADLRLLAHDRTAQSLQGLVTALIGFATLMLGGFSRFGVWRQIILAIFLVILVKIFESAITGMLNNTPALWPLIYAPIVAGAGLAAALLAWPARPVWLRGFPLARRGAA